MQSTLRRNRWFFGVSVAVVIAVVLGLVAYNLWRLRTAAVEGQQEAVAQKAIAFEEHLTQTLSVIDLNLVSLAGQHTQEAALQAVLRNARYLRSVSVVGEDGRILSSSEPRNVDKLFSATDFLPEATQTAPFLRVGPLSSGRDVADARPVVSGQVAPAPSFIAVQRDVPLPSGDSVRLVAVVNPDYFLNYYGRHGVDNVEVEILRADGSLLLGTAPDFIPGALINRSVMARLIQADSGQLQQDDVGRMRLTGYRASRNFPVVVVVHEDMQTVLSVWRQEVHTTLLFVGVVLALALGLAAVFFNRYQRLAVQQAQWVHELDTQKYALDQHAIVSRTDAQGLITYANDRFCLISGYSREELIGQNHRIIKSALHPASFYAAMWDTIAKGEVWHGEVCNRRKSGELYWVNATMVPVLGADGFVKEYIGIRTDITDRKKVESSLEVARAAAEQASVSKSQFLANMSHEIRTPMNAILGMLQLLQRTPLSEEQKDYAGKTEGAARSLLGLLNDILDFSKVEAGKMELDPRTFAVADLQRDVDVILSSNLASKPVRLIFDVAPEVPDYLLGDDMRLRQVLVNLGGNAIKFTQQGEVRIALRMVPVSNGQDGVEFSVRDTGIGIAPQHMEHIFDGFTQAESSTTRRFGGTGLGLAICQRLVRMMDGELQLRSTLGEGSCFYFTLPLPAVARPAVSLATPIAEPSAPTAEVPASGDKAQRLQGMRLLVVEDNKINQMVAKGLLSQEGAIVTLAENGALGVQAVANSQSAFDAVLMDLQMPVMDGLEATRAIRQDLGITHLPIIAMTANAMASDRDACLAVGMNDHVGKPFELDHLVAVLQRLARPATKAVVPPAVAPVAPVQPHFAPGDLDVDGAVARVGGDHSIYASVLQAFADEMQQVPAQMKAHWAAQETHQALRTMHTIKGLAATVGARHLSGVAAVLEHELKTGASDAEHHRMLEQLQSAIDALTINVAPVLQRYQQMENQETPQTDAPLDAAQLQRDLQALDALLTESNMLALEAYTAIQKRYAAHLGAQLDALRQAMERFDFAAAHTFCVQLMEQHRT